METIENGVDMLVLLNSLSKMLRHGIAAFTLSVGVVGLASAQVMPPADLDFDGENCADLYGMRTFNLADWAFSLPSDVPQNYYSEVLQAQYDHTVSPVCNQLVDTMLNTDEGRIGSSDNDRSLIWGANGHVGDFTISSISGAQFDLVKLDLGLLLGSSQSFSVAGYKDGTLVTVIETVSYSDVSDSLGEVMFTSVTTDNVSSVSGSFATLIFGDAYNSIDELRINSPFAALEIDNIDVSVPPPSVTTLSPISGPLAGGNSVTIIGTEFSTTTAVSFGGTAASSYTVDSATQITATAPAGSAGAVNVAVTTAGGTATAAGAYTYLSAPTVTSLSPTSGATAGGTSVVITGTNFTGATAVSFGGTAASSYTVDSATQITATAPAGSAGAVNVAVTTAGGTATAAGAYTYVAAPSSDATLSSLVLSQGTLSPTFSSGTTSYTASVSNAVSSLTITPTVTEGTATIAVNSVAVSSGSASGAISLNVGSNTITTIVTAGDGTTSQTYTTTVTRAAASQTPATEFAEYEAEISNVITSDAGRSLSGTISSNRSTVQAARERFIAGRSPDAMDLETVPFDVDGGFESNPTSISSKGTFFGQTVTNTGHRRFMFGDFDIQHDSETGSNTATMNGKVAWERSVSEKTLLGYVIGGELVRSNIRGSFEGEQNRLGLSVGGYTVHEIARKFYLDGFFSLGAGRNNLTMTNDVLTLDSEYTTGTMTFGAALSGVVEQQGFEIWPELSLNYGKTWLGHINFIGSAHGTTDTTLSLEAGTIAMSNVVFRPQIRVPVGDSLAKNYITFAPRLTCEYIRTDVTQQNCGTGVELTYSSVTADGQSNLSAKIMSDSIGSRKNSAIQINLQHRF